MRRLLPEWAAQSAVLLAWPDEDTDWSPYLDEVQAEYGLLIGAITRFERAVVLVRDARRAEQLLDRLSRKSRARVTPVVMDYDDTWTRDYGPFSVGDADGVTLCDFVFDGWGGKYPARRDNAATRGLAAMGFLDAFTLEHHDHVLEGGALESDGLGTALCNRDTFEVRDPDFSTRVTEDWLEATLGLDRVLWLQGTQLQGDDTDGHVDTLARFASVRDIVHQSCDDRADPHWDMFQHLESQLARFRMRDAGAYALHALPWPGPLFHEAVRLPASYANFLIINGAVLVPEFGVSADTQACDVLRNAFPDRAVLGIPSAALLRQFGGIHCVTMQLPAGLTLTGSPGHAVNSRP